MNHSEKQQKIDFKQEENKSNDLFNLMFKNKSAIKKEQTKKYYKQRQLNKYKKPNK